MPDYLDSMAKQGIRHWNAFTAPPTISRQHNTPRATLVEVTTDLYAALPVCVGSGAIGYLTPFIEQRMKYGSSESLARKDLGGYSVLWRAEVLPELLNAPCTALRSGETWGFIDER